MGRHGGLPLRQVVGKSEATTRNPSPRESVAALPYTEFMWTLTMHKLRADTSIQRSIRNFRVRADRRVYRFTKRQTGRHGGLPLRQVVGKSEATTRHPSPREGVAALPSTEFVWTWTTHKLRAYTPVQRSIKNFRVGADRRVRPWFPDIRCRFKSRRGLCRGRLSRLPAGSMCARK